MGQECRELYLNSPSTPLWHGAQLKKAQEQHYLYLHVLNVGSCSLQHILGTFKISIQNTSKLMQEVGRFCITLIWLCVGKKVNLIEIKLLLSLI
jgi:hypothetical protein